MHLTPPHSVSLAAAPCWTEPHHMAERADVNAEGDQSLISVAVRALEGGHVSRTREVWIA